jgi:hypothetical protein
VQFYFAAKIAVVIEKKICDSENCADLCGVVWCEVIVFILVSK